MISCIISSFERPLRLLTCVTSLLAQENQEVEIIIIDNSNDPQKADMISKFVGLEEERVKYISTKGLISEELRLTCYEPSSILGVPIARGEWLCFPCDDSYYVPGFADTMIQAASNYGWEFVYCSAIHDPRWNGATYSLVQGGCLPRYITKSSFIIKTELFKRVGWPEHHRDWRDWELVKNINDMGIRHGCAPGVLHVSN